MTELKRLEQLVEERKKQAEEKKISHKINTLLKEHGEIVNVYDSGVRWDPWEGFYHHIESGCRYSTDDVVIASGTRDNRVFTDVFFSGKLVYREEHISRGNEIEVAIRAYISGDWEERLEKSYNEIIHERSEKRRQKQIQEELQKVEKDARREREDKQNFGL